MLGKYYSTNVYSNKLISDVFQEKDGVKVQVEVSFAGKRDDHEVESLSLFRDGIKPMYEDPMNKNGCDIQIKAQRIDQLQGIWEDVVLNLIGENFDHSGKYMCGARIVHKRTMNKGNNGKNKKNSMFRVELWLSTKESEFIDKIKEFLSKYPFSNTKDIKIVYIYILYY